MYLTFFVLFLPTLCSEMIHSNYKTMKFGFFGFLVDTIKTREKVIRYSVENQVEHTEHPTVKKRGKAKTIRIFASVPEVF